VLNLVYYSVFRSLAYCHSFSSEVSAMKTGSLWIFVAVFKGLGLCLAGTRFSVNVHRKNGGKEF
jgi:hypothetical protein